MSGLGALRVDTACADAAESARGGRLDEALAVLDGLTEADDPQVLDLRARILAQRGDLDAADAAWRRLDEVDPGNVGAAAGRAAISREPGRRTRRRVAALTVAVLVAGVATAAVVVGSRPTGPVPVAPPAPVASPVPPAAPPPPLSSELAGVLAVPGAEVVAREDGVLVRPVAGLFDREARLTPAGAALLDDIGARLRGRSVSVEVTGRSVAVPGGPRTGGTTVGLARASAAAGELAESSGLPLTAFRLATAPQEPADPSSDAARSVRSVELVVRRA